MTPHTGESGDVLRGLGWRGAGECKVVPNTPRCANACGCYPAEATVSVVARNPCRYCEDGYIEDVDDMTAAWIECEFCDGTGDRYGRGPTLSNPHPVDGS